jgi:hypothetical protein
VFQLVVVAALEFRCFQSPPFLRFPFLYRCDIDTVIDRQQHDRE